MGTKTLSQLPVATAAAAENIFHVRQGLADKQMSLPVLSRFVIRDSAYGYQELEITTNTLISEIQRIHTVLKFNSSSAVSCELPFSGDIEAGATVWAYNIGTGTAALTYQSGVFTSLPTGERARLVWNGAAWILDSSTRYAEASEWFRINGGPRIKKGATADTLAVRNSTDTDYGDLEVKGLTLHETITADGGEFNTLAVTSAAEFNAPTGAPFSVASSEKVVNLNADKLDGYDASTSATANTIPVRDSNGKVPGSITGDAETVDGYHANTGAVAGTVPVRDSNGKVPGSITGDAETVDGYHANTGAVAGTVPVRDAKGKVPGCLTIDDLYPVNIGIYTQYPAANSNDDATAFPVSQRPATLFPGTTWEEVWNTEAITFRTPGSPVESQNDDRINGLQTDQFQAFQIGAEADDAGLKNTWMGTHSRDVAIGHWVAYANSTGFGLYTEPYQGSAKQIKPVSNGVNGNPRMGMETRMRNRLWKKWKRIA